MKTEIDMHKPVSARELSAITGVNYERVLTWFKMAGFPRIPETNRVFWDDFRQWVKDSARSASPATDAGAQPNDAGKDGAQAPMSGLPSALPPKAERLIAAAA